MTPLAWTLVAVALLVGWAIGRLMSRRPEPMEPPEDPRLDFERDRADEAEKKVAAQETEMRDWATSHKALESQVADLKAQVAQASPAEDSSEAAAAIEALEAKVTQLEGQIAAGAGSVTRDEVIEAAHQEQQITVLRANLARAEGRIADLERRLARHQSKV